jgi:hypothetical protein
VRLAFKDLNLLIDGTHRSISAMFLLRLLRTRTSTVPIEKALKIAAKLRGGRPTSALGHRELASTVLLK